MSQDIHGPPDMEVSRWENHQTKQGIVRCKPCFSVPEGGINMDE